MLNNVEIMQAFASVFDDLKSNTGFTENLDEERIRINEAVRELEKSSVMSFSQLNTPFDC